MDFVTHYLRPESRADWICCLGFVLLSAVLYLLPTGFEDQVDSRGVRCRGEVLSADNSEVIKTGMVSQGTQELELELLDGAKKGHIVEASNHLMGQMDRDEIFAPGDVALVVLTLSPDGSIQYVNAQAQYRIGGEMVLLGGFAVLLLLFAGWTGAKALLSFAFAALGIWKILVPAMLKGADPVLVSLAVVVGLAAAIIFLVAGVNRRGLTAFTGCILGVGISCLLGLYFVESLHIHGAVLPFSETLLYSGFAHLDLERVFIGAVFLAASGAVMDLAVDVAASMEEVAAKKPDISRTELIRSGLHVGRAVVGTMTTTLLLAYSGGYVTLFMAFMAQGIPMVNFFNLVYVAAEVLKTLVGSLGLVAVGPLTAVAGGFILARGGSPARTAAPANPGQAPG